MFGQSVFLRCVVRETLEIAATGSDRQTRSDGDKENGEDALHGPNETKMSDGGRARASSEVEVWEVISKVERTAVRRSLHRMVRRFVHCEKTVSKNRPK
jgi:hypothetical protein